MDLKELKKPFEPADIEFRAGSTNQNKTSAMALAYVTARAVMDRLDSVCGPENWKDQYQAGPQGGVLCGISIRINDEWITKWDGAENTNFEPVKGGLSDALKRCAVKWGIGRELYALPAVWVSCEAKGKRIVLNENEARAKLFGQQKPKPQAPTNGNGSGRQFKSIDGLVYEVCYRTGYKEDEVKDRLKQLGHTTFSTAKSAKMYADVIAMINAEHEQAGADHGGNHYTGKGQQQ